jgi:hypothetical protein
MEIDAADRFDMISELRAELEQFRSAMLDQNLAATIRKIPQYIRAAPINSASSAISTSQLASQPTTSPVSVESDILSIKP